MDFKGQDREVNFQRLWLGLCRLAIAYFNTYSGIIVIGVKDDDFSVCSVSEKFDVSPLTPI
jgi:hypothetical protein